ncbi:unnamed protein product [Nippostrongylus brasiliensis]|uniref:Uncharacterized protein n=1 Tax=Nippostrongylus brasiliensis TaxID=27835 RepID=A0A0N4XFM4_NIPBR|nr:unnamed protein product [Nippostrongylus brasiliensis]
MVSQVLQFKHAEPAAPVNGVKCMNYMNCAVRRRSRPLLKYGLTGGDIRKTVNCSVEAAQPPPPPSRYNLSLSALLFAEIPRPSQHSLGERTTPSDQISAT